MEFPPFDLLHWFEDAGEGYLQLSKSEVLGFHFSEFGHEFPDLDLGVATPRGGLPLRTLIGAQHQVWPEQVLVCNGASEANFLIHAALLKPGDEALVEVPQYPPLRDMPTGLGATVKPIPRLADEQWRFDFDAFEKAISPRTRLAVLTNLNNPTSGMLGSADLKRLADLAEAHKFYIHVDETFRELAFDEAPPTASLFGPRYVVTSTLTKAYGLGGLRLGWVAASPDVIEKVKALKDYTSVCPNAVSEALAVWALSRRKGFLGRAKRICEENRQAVRAWLDRNPDVACLLPAHGNYCYPRLPVDVNALADRLKEHHKVVIAPGRFFGADGHFRLGYGGKKAEIERGLQHVDLAMKTVARARKTR